MQTETVEPQVAAVTEQMVATPETSSESPRAGRAGRDRRRRFWIDTKYQLPITLLALGAALFFVVFYNVSMHMMFRNSSAAMIELAPETAGILQKTNQIFSGISLISSLVFVIGVWLISVRMSHRTAGPAYKIQMHIKRIIAGDFNHQICLRKNDNLQHLADDLNVMLQSMQERTRKDLIALKSAALEVEGMGSGEGPRRVTAELQRLIRDKERSISG